MAKLMFSIVPFDIRKEHIEKLSSCDSEFVLSHKGEKLYGLRISWEEKSYSSHDEWITISYIIPESVMMSKIKSLLDKGKENAGEITFPSHEDEENLLDLLEDLEIQGDIVDVAAEE